MMWWFILWLIGNKLVFFNFLFYYELFYNYEYKLIVLS